MSTSALQIEDQETSAVPLPTDFHFTDRDFHWLRKVASDHSGIVLSDSKRNMVYSRLAKRLRTLGLKKFSDYRKILEQNDPKEFSEFINAMTTNLTAFFRENHHFEHLRQAASTIIAQSGRRQRPFRAWSAGCSTGEEPYTISITLDQALRDKGGYEVLATDLDTNVLRTASNGIYPEDRIAGLDPRVIQNNFLRGAGEFSGKVRVKSHIQKHIKFQQLNLVKQWSMPEPFDVVFCRNVIIYFDRPTKQRLFDRFAEVIAKDGFLYLGHSESLFQTTERFVPAGKTLYQKVR